MSPVRIHPWLVWGFTTVAVFAQSGCTVVSGNGDIVTQQRNLTGFSQIETLGPFDVRVDDGPTFQVSVTADSNIQQYIETRLDGQVLIIDAPLGTTFNNATYQVDVVLPALTKADFAGSGSMGIVLANPGSDLSLASEGSGLVTVNAQLATLNLQETGSGAINLVGKAQSWTALVTGSGRVDGRNMQVQDAAITVTGSGTLLALVEHNASFLLSGSGSIDWWGKATVISSSSTGSGHITHHDGE